jgi:hypothetical protein
MERFLIALGVFATLSTTAYAQISQLEYDQLPKEIRDEVDETRAACKKLGAEDDPYFGSGLQIIDLDGKGSRDILLDYQHVCNGWFKGGNCSNRGCDLRFGSRPVGIRGGRFSMSICGVQKNSSA